MWRSMVMLAALALSGPAWAGAWQGLSFGIGGAAGYDLTWQKPCGSPMVSIGAEVGGPKVRGWFGIDSAPTFWMGLGYDVAAIPAAMLTLGVNGGGDVTRVGGYITGGYVGLGGGVQVRLLPWADGGGGRHGFEIRADWLVPRAMRGALMYTYRPGWGLKSPE